MKISAGMLHRLCSSSLQRVSSLLAERPGNQSFVRSFSSSTVCLASLPNSERGLFFDGALQQSPSLTSSSTEKSTSSAAFLLNIFGKAVHSKEANKEALKGFFIKKQGQLSEDAGLLQLFRHLSKKLDLDRAVQLCNRLPSKRLRKGFDTLINVLIERAGEHGTEHTHQGVLADKVLELLGQMKGKGHTPSNATCQRWFKWLSVKGDVTRFQKTLQLIKEEIPDLLEEFECSESMVLSEAGDAKNTKISHAQKEVEEAKYDSFSGNNHPAFSAKDVSKLLDGIDVSQISCKTRLNFMFQCFGRLGYQKISEDCLVNLQSKGTLKDDLMCLIDSYAKGLTQTCPKSRDIKKDVEGFKKINDLLKLSTTTSFNTLIRHCCNHGEIDLCIDLIQTMKKNGLEPLATTYEPLIVFFARTLEIYKAEDILQSMKNNGMLATVKAYECLITAHTKSDNIEKAYNLIEDISLEKLTADMYTPIFHAYGKKGQLTQALTVFKEMKRKKIKPNADNFASLILAFASRKGLRSAELVFKLFKKQKDFPTEDHKRVMAAMIRVYAMCGKNKQVEEMTSSAHADLLVTVDAKSAMLSGFARQGKIGDAMKIYNEIRRMGAWPASGVFLTLLTAMGNAGELNQLFALFESFKTSMETKNRVNQEELMSIACCAVVHPLIHHNELEKALKFIQQVQRDNVGDVETLCLKVFTNDDGKNTSEQEMHLTLEDKLKFVKAMRERLKLQPTRIAYESLLESCAREKDTDRADYVVQMMKSDNLHANIFTYLILLRIAVSGGDLKKVKKLLTEMRREMESSGLHDDHVIKVVTQILSNFKSSNGVARNSKKLLNVLYPSAI